jgi:hypothetical protein
VRESQRLMGMWKRPFALLAAMTLDGPDRVKTLY